MAQSAFQPNMTQPNAFQVLLRYLYKVLVKFHLMSPMAKMRFTTPTVKKKFSISKSGMRWK